MKVSVVVIAHNEEQHIGHCLQSLLSQSRSADEIIVINHNSTDKTGAIARTYGVQVIEYEGSVGSAYARIRGFEVATGDIILCIDGDAYAEPSWISTLTSLFEKNDALIIVGSWVRMAGLFLAHIASARWYFFTKAKGEKGTDYLYGASYGIRGAGKGIAIKALTESIRLSAELGLAYNPDDYWLALFMLMHGEIKITNKTWVIAQTKETTNWQFIRRSIIAQGIRNKMQGFLKHHPLETVI